MAAVALDLSKLLGFRLEVGSSNTGQPGSKVGVKTGVKLGTKFGRKIGLKA